MKYATSVAVAAPGLPLAVQHVKTHLGIYDTDRDRLIPTWIRSAWAGLESEVRRTLLHTRYTLTLRCFPTESLRIGSAWAYLGIVLPHAPVARVVSIAYVDSAGATQTMASSDYVLNRRATPSFIHPAYGTSWPAAREQEDAITVTYESGYASVLTADAVANTITVTGPTPYAVDDAVRFSNSGGDLPSPLLAAQTYYIKTASGGVYTLAATVGGATIDLTTAGTETSYIGEMPAEAWAWMLIQCGEHDKGREETVTGTVVQEMKFVGHLLDGLRVWLP